MQKIPPYTQTLILDNQESIPKLIRLFGHHLSEPPIQDIELVYSIEAGEQENALIMNSLENNQDGALINSLEDTTNNYTIDPDFTQLEQEAAVNPIRVIAMQFSSNNPEQFFLANFSYIRNNLDGTSTKKIIPVQNFYDTSNPNVLINLLEGKDYAQEEFIFDGDTILEVANLLPRTRLEVELTYVIASEYAGQQVGNSPQNHPIKTQDEKSLNPETLLSGNFFQRKILYPTKTFLHKVLMPPWFIIGLIILITVMVIIAKED
ncbi:hypothetical protein BKI52_02670 [marine bacterium AO1-C]|nr:hypothetical protein BKI52_02670 [marine bacterium AO1-C]